MDSHRWQQVQELFHQTLEQPANERLSFLEAHTGADTNLLEEVQGLLKEDSQGTSPLDQNLAEISGKILGEATPALPFYEIGPYRVLKLLGEGGMGVVYLGKRDDLASLAAIKLLRDGWISPARRERFANEQRTLAQLTHPGIARLYDADTLADGTPWFAMEYVDGIPLTDFCRRHKASIADRLRLFRAMCEAVRYAHSLAIIHRDLKPSNVLVQTDGNIKLLDFGIAKQLEPEKANFDQTRTGLRLLTPAYAAPEQLRGEPAGTYTDVYALGVILYQLLTDRLPFSSDELDASIPTKTPGKPSASGRRLPQNAHVTAWADLDVLCLTALQKEPERRYRSVDALIRDVDHYLGAEPLDASPDSLLYRTKKFITRNRRAVVAASLGVAVIAALAIFYTVRLAAARNAALAEAARTQRVLNFTLNLFDGGDKEVGPASNLRVSELIHRGIDDEARLSRDPDVRADLDETLGQVCQKLGEFDKAGPLLTRALNQRRTLFGANSPKVAESLLKLGLLRDEQAKLPEAERFVREGLAVSRQLSPPNKPTLAEADQALGKVLEDRGSYQEAIQYLNEAVRLRSEPWAEKADLAASLLELANVHFYMGHYAQAQALNERLLTMHRQLYGARHPLVAADLINLGAIQQDLARYPEAEAFHRQALAIKEAYYGPDHHETATSLTLLARALAKENRLAEAHQLLQRAVEIQERVFGNEDPNVASAVNELGSVAMQRGQYTEALADFQRMAAIYRSVYGGTHYLIGIALANEGSVYMAQKNNPQAEALYRQAIQMYLLTLPANSLNEGITRIKLGRTLLRERRFAEAEKETSGGYQIVSKQAAPSASWLQNAREDLVADYNALGQPDRAKTFSRISVALAPKPHTR
jgi:serine/threonine-protein kinase